MASLPKKTLEFGIKKLIHHRTSVADPTFLDMQKRWKERV